MKTRLPYLLSILAAAGTGISVAQTDSSTAGNSSRNLLAQALVAADVEGDPTTAARNYKKVIENFDQQRREAAQAMFALAELQRKRGQLSQATHYYSRILREFPDFPNLAEPSLRQLQQLVPPPPDAPPEPPALDVTTETALVGPSGFSSPHPEMQQLPGDPILQELTSKRLETEQQLAAMMHDRSEGHPEVQRLRALLDRVQAQIQERMTTLQTPRKIKDKQKDKQKQSSSNDVFQTIEEEAEAPSNTVSQTVETEESQVVTSVRPTLQFRNDPQANDELRLLRDQLRRVQLALQTAKEKHESYSTKQEQIGQVDVTALPDSIASNPMYGALKQDYQEAVINGQEEKMQEALNKLERWKELKLKEWEGYKQATLIEIHKLEEQKAQLNRSIHAMQDAGQPRPQPTPRQEPNPDRVHPAN